MPVIKFVKENKEVEVPEGTNLRKAAIQAGINLNQGLNGIGQSINKFMNCKGFGMCGTCRVDITQGMENTNDFTLREKIKFKTPIPTPIPDPVPCLAYIGHEDTMRLACCTTVHGDVEVQNAPEIDLFGENFFS